MGALLQRRPEGLDAAAQGVAAAALAEVGMAGKRSTPARIVAEPPRSPGRDVCDKGSLRAHPAPFPPGAGGQWDGLVRASRIAVLASPCAVSSWAEREAAQAKVEKAAQRAGEAEARAAETNRRADEAERRATTANERWDRFQQKRIAEAQEAATRAADTAQVASPEAEARRPLWHRIFRRRVIR